MPLTTPTYCTFVSQSGGDVPWTNPSNMDGPPDGSQATAALGLFNTSTYVANLRLDENPSGRVTAIYVTVRASDSNYAVEPATLHVQLYNEGPVGTAISTPTTSASLTDYTVGGPPSAWGLSSFTPAFLADFRVNMWMTRADATTTVGCDSVSVTAMIMAGGARTRSRLRAR